MQRSDNRRSAISERFRAPTLNQAFCWREPTPCQHQPGLSLRTAVRVEPAVEVARVGLDGAHADEELGGDPAVALAGGYELKRLELPLAQVGHVFHSPFWSIPCPGVRAGNLSAGDERASRPRCRSPRGPKENEEDGRADQKVQDGAELRIRARDHPVSHVVHGIPGGMAEESGGN